MKHPKMLRIAFGTSTLCLLLSLSAGPSCKLGEDQTNGQNPAQEQASNPAYVFASGMEVLVGLPSGENSDFDWVSEVSGDGTIALMSGKVVPSQLLVPVFSDKQDVVFADTVPYSLDQLLFPDDYAILAKFGGYDVASVAYVTSQGNAYIYANNKGSWHSPFDAERVVSTVNGVIEHELIEYYRENDPYPLYMTVQYLGVRGSVITSQGELLRTSDLVPLNKMVGSDLVRWQVQSPWSPTPEQSSGGEW